MKAILDTNVISELRRNQPNPAVVERVRKLGPENIYLTSVTIGELSHGIHLLDEGRKKHDLLAWLDGIGRHYQGRVLPFDHQAASIWGRCVVEARKQGLPVSREDSQIAAIALRFELPVFSRDTQPFQTLGVEVINPWEDGEAIKQ